MIILFSSEILNCISPRDENINIISGQRECNIFLDFTGKFNHSCYVILLTITAVYFFTLNITVISNHISLILSLYTTDMHTITTGNCTSELKRKHDVINIYL